MNPTIRTWLWSVLLPLPLWIIIALHYVSAPEGSHPTGFLQQDTPFYAARVREVFDTGRFLPFFSNPSDPSYDGPRIYFQLQSLLLAPIAQLTGLSAPFVILLSQILFSILYARMALALYVQVVGMNGRFDRLFTLLFFWGGGIMALLALPGIALTILNGTPPLEALRSIFKYEPDGLGWWALNVGRNVINQYEAYFHVFFFGAIIALLRGRHALALICSAILVASHIVSGLEILIVLLTAGVIERWCGNKTVPIWFICGTAVMLVLHLGFYMVFQNSFPEHHLLSLQNKEPWLLQARSMVPAYALVGLMVAWQLRTLDHARRFFASATNRILASWAFAVFLLSNHEFAIEPMQPVHFDRGYTWAPLFLLGVPTLKALLDRLRSALLRTMGVTCIVGIFLSDNICWFSALAVERTVLKMNGGDFYVSRDQKEVLDWLNGNDDMPHPVVVSEDMRLGYLVIAYTPLRSWASHDHETPLYHQRAAEIRTLSEAGTMAEAWQTLPVLWVVSPGSLAEKALLENGARLRFTNGGYRIYSRN